MHAIPLPNTIAYIARWQGGTRCIWANPLQYFMSGMAINELTSPDWAEEVPGLGASIGRLALSAR